MAITKWIIDPMHSELQFKVKHLMITTVTGYFRQFSGEVETEDEDFTQITKLVISADTDSIDTNNAQRDGHLRSAEFFNAPEYPQMTFKGAGLKPASDDDKFKLEGEITIRSVTLPLTLDVDFAGVVLDPYGQTKAGFTVTGKILRKDFGLVWDAVTEAGQVVLSNEVRILCEIQLVKQA